MNNPQQKSKKIWVVVMAFCLVVAVACVGVLVWMKQEEARVDAALAVNSGTEPSLSASHEPSTVVTIRPTPSITTEKPTSNLTGSTEHPELTIPERQPEIPDAVAMPYTFEYLKGLNSDIYAWLYLGSTGQEFPVLEKVGDPDFYLSHDIYGNYSSRGSLYSQSNYNMPNFIDRCTLIYGHNMTVGGMFGDLESSTVDLDLDDASDSKIYFQLTTEDKILTYRIACCGLYSPDHVLYYHNFGTEEGFNSFFKHLKDFSNSNNFSTTFQPQFGDNLVILSTCHSPSALYRYLVVGVLVGSREA